MHLHDLWTFDQTMAYLKEKKRPHHLLLGNGFSISYNKEIFSYNALADFIENSEEEKIKTLFSVVNTKNFESIMDQLDNLALLASALNADKNFIENVRETSAKLKLGLIEAVKTLHPEHVFKIPENQSQASYAFLSHFLSQGGQIFSTNYDLLLYWVLMRNQQDAGKEKECIDGFGRELENPDEVKVGGSPTFSELRWGKYKTEQNIFHLHGTLPLFDDGTEIIKEEFQEGAFLLEKVSKRIDQKSYPIFVTAGNGREKLHHIRHNQYLSYCYDKLSSITGSLVTFGFSFSDSDMHIIDALNRAAHPGKGAEGRLVSIYIGVYSEQGLNRLDSIASRFQFKVKFYNANTVDIWGTSQE